MNDEREATATPKTKHTFQKQLTRWIDIGMKQGRNELALGRFAGIFWREFHGDLVDTAFPIRAGFPRYACLPHHEFRRPITLVAWTRVKPNRMIATPRPTFFLQAAHGNSR